jgi:PAS domain S-box-containing protein
MASIPGLHPEALLHAVLDNVGVALVAVDSQGKFVFTNQAALKMFGVPLGMKGLSLEEWRRDYVFRDSQGKPIHAEQAPILRALAGEQVPPQDMDVTLPDGRRKWLHAAGHHFSVLGVTGVFVIITDETEEIELRQALERAQRIETVGLLVGALAHDLNNMLSVISENLALLQADRSVPETAHTRLQQMATALHKGTALATRLVRYRHEHELKIRSVQVNDLVTAALELVHPLLKGGIRVHAELGVLPMAEADPSRIEQVFVNLIVNALDAMPEGGDLTVRTELLMRDAVPDLQSEGGEGKSVTSFLCVTVADTGIGIPEDIQDRIFEPFFTTKPEGKGSGLGLASADAIVRQHSGHIKVQSAPGAGAKFNVYLPVRKQP